MVHLLQEKQKRLKHRYLSLTRKSSGGSIDVKDIADEEEFRMIKDIVVAIVQDYNLLRKELKLDYNENEIKTGIPEL